MKDYKTVHAIRGQGWAVECTDELSDHDKRMSSRQTFNVHRKWSTRKAQALLACTQPIQEWWDKGVHEKCNGLRKPKVAWV